MLPPISSLTAVSEVALRVRAIKSLDHRTGYDGYQGMDIGGET
jgi:hypothetical protein